MLNLKTITLREIRLPLKEPFRISSGEVLDRRILLIEVEDQDGSVGWGECVAGEAPNYSPETIDGCWLIIQQWVAPRLLHKSFTGPEEVFPHLQENFRGNLMSKAALEMACWELAARKQGVSLSKLVGGTREQIATGISLGIQDSPEKLVEKAADAFEQGYRKVKIKIKPGKDVQYIRAARQYLGEQAPLMADANNAYTLGDLDTLRALDQFGLMMIEQPLAWDDVVEHAALQAQLRTPICLDESITSVDRARDMARLGSGKIINIKPGRVGGFAASKAIHDFCQAKGIPVWCGGMLESGVGRGHNVALASLPNFVLPGDVSPSARYWAQDIVMPAWEMSSEGMVTVPVDCPGIGVQVDRDRVENLTVRTERLT